MQTMQRQFGKLLTRSADDAQVAMLIHDFDEADKMLSTLIDAAKSWQQAWVDILQRQSAMLTTYEVLYAPIVTSDGSASDKFSVTPQSTMERLSALKVAYTELKDEMIEEAQMVYTRIVSPAKDAKAAIQPYKKVIKKREDRKLDFERYKGRVESLEKKTKRSDRENTALQKHRVDLEAATSAYESADEHLKSTLPGITQAAYSLLPHLLNNQILIQNALLGQLYTTLHNFSGDYGFPSPAPEFEDIIATFDAEFSPLRRELESDIKMISSGKAVRQPMELGHEGKSITGLNIRNGISNRRNTSQPAATTSRLTPPAFESAKPPSPQPPQIDAASRPQLQTAKTWAAGRGQATLSPDTANGGQRDYFSPASHVSQLRPRQPSATSLGSMSSSASTLSGVIGKKKPPPPPPPKKKNLGSPAVFVTALYDFDGEGAGDLSFREGDRIKVVKKTGSTDDWWEGELRGAVGSFPANYCQ